MEPKNKNLESALERAIQEATDDTTFRKVKRMSYSGNAADEVIKFYNFIYYLNLFSYIIYMNESFKALFELFNLVFGSFVYFVGI